ncbi:MAG: phosphoribosylanthranilate isomerase [Pirellulales bacterium]
MKICGITNTRDAQVAAEAGADAIGLNFYSGSPRCCTLEVAKEIAAALGPRVCKVGVFVNAAADEIRSAAESVPLDAVQLHGDEPPDFLRAIRALPIVRAMRFGDDLAPIDAYLAACHRLLAMPRMLLLDASRGGQFGGTGTPIDWALLAANRRHLGGLPLVLAGGLTPDNVAAAIGAVRPWAVDVASGVEIAPGSKSPQLVVHFVSAAKKAFEKLSARD